ncbi:hypothetical protein GCM10009557_95180 [Virgisporangium ochraceum]|uniref:Uncharacterized protein n=1 Tax=Virgisporangium ochraceum TaxID=65505 RepID=A0A8J4EIT9_9ACTN|nr:hypothetical protein [Virgisporangium ochraceum]GIJ73602.1 hypothetical protein Voc01_085190 [Virgisporangium ochraceum]
MGHVFARLAGYGMAVVPHWPYTVERDGGGSDAVRVTRWSATGPEHAVVTTDRAPDVRWPVGFRLESGNDPGDRTLFYLLGGADEAIFPQGPVPRVRLAAPDALAAPGQTVVDRRVDGDGVGVTELGYEHGGEPWWQAHWTVAWDEHRFLVVTAQAPATHADHTRVAAAEVAESMIRT